MDWLCWWCNHTADIVSYSTALAFVTKINEKYQSISLSSIQVNNWHKIFITVEKLDVISWLEKGEQNVDICHYVMFAYSSIHTFCGNADRIKEMLSEELTRLFS
jgi:hypothetical protein